MRVSQVLQKCLPHSLLAMHALRERALLRAVEALLRGRRLTLMDVARAWPDATRIRAPLKAFDRLLSNRHLHAERASIDREMARWLLRSAQPVILIDWSDLKPDKSWCLLRAAVPVGGRSLTLLHMVVPGPEKRFLQHLRAIVPEDVTPILVTDVGFRTPWFRGVSALGWHWLGRLDQWVDSRRLHVLASTTPHELPPMLTNRSDLIECRLAVYAKACQGRRSLNKRRPDRTSRSTASKKASARER